MTRALRPPAEAGRRLLAALAAATLTLVLLPLASASAQEAPAPRSIDLACPEGEVPDAGFPDQSPTFQDYIDCVIAYELAVGRTDGTYGPTASITRGQMATFVRNLLEEAGVEVDPAAEVDFTDIAGTTHEGSIRAIANTDPAIVEGFLDGTYRPSAAVRRDQMASFLATAHEVITAEALPVVETDFTDIDGNVHEDNIERLAGTGITVGTTATTYAPRRAITRGQMAAFFARHVDILVELAHTETRFPVFTALTVDPGEATNFVDDDHDFTVAAVDQVGAVIGVEGTVYYEVYTLDEGTGTWNLDNPGAEGDRTAELAEGEAGFGYTRADARSDAIVACFAPEADGNGNGVLQQEAVCVVTADDTLEDDLSNLDGELSATAGFKDWVVADGSVAIQLNWQNELFVETDDEDAPVGPRYGNVDTLAAFLHADEGAGEAELRWNVDAGLMGTSGSTLVTSEIPGDGSVAGTDFHIHAGGIDENGGVVVPLAPPTLVDEDEAGEPLPVPTEDEPRDLFLYDLGGTVEVDGDDVQAIVDALAAADGGFVDFYLNVHTVDNPAGEVRGQVQDAAVSDGGLSQLPPVFKYAEPTGTELTVTGLDLVFDIAVEDAGELGLVAGDFTLTVNDAPVVVDAASVAGGAVALEFAPQPVEDGDVYEVTIGDAAAQQILAAAAEVREGNATESVRTRGFAFDLLNGDGGVNGLLRR